MAEYGDSNNSNVSREFSPEQSNLIDYSLRLVEGQKPVYQNFNYKQVETTASEKLRRFVTGIGQFRNPFDYMRYVRTKAVPKEIYKIYAEDDQEYVRMITASYATDDSGLPTDTVTGLTFTKELSVQYLSELTNNGKARRDPPLVIDLLDPATFVQDDEVMRRASGLLDATTFVNRSLASRINVSQAKG